MASYIYKKSHCSKVFSCNESEESQVYKYLTHCIVPSEPELSMSLPTNMDIVSSGSKGVV